MEGWWLNNTKDKILLFEHSWVDLAIEIPCAARNHGSHLSVTRESAILLLLQVRGPAAIEGIQGEATCACLPHTLYLSSWQYLTLSRLICRGATPHQFKGEIYS